MTKAEQEAREKHEAWEKDQAKQGHVTLPRSGEPGAPDYVPPKAAPDKKKPAAQ